MQPCRAPKVIGKATIELLPGVKVCFFELGMRSERKCPLFRKAQEPRIVVVGRLMKTLSK